MDTEKIIGLVIHLLGPILFALFQLVSTIYIKKVTHNAVYCYRSDKDHVKKRFFVILGIFTVLFAFTYVVLYFIDKNDEGDLTRNEVSCTLFTIPVVVGGACTIENRYVYIIDKSNILRCYSLFKKANFDLNSPFELNITLEEYLENVRPAKVINNNAVIKQDYKSFKMFLSYHPDTEENEEFVKYILSLDKNTYRSEKKSD